MSMLKAEIFETKVDEVVVVAPCIEVVLHLDTASDEGLLDFYHQSRAVLGERITHYQSGNMKSFGKLTPRAESMVPTWFTTPAKGERDYYMSLSEGDPNQQTTASTIHLSAFRRPLESITDKVKQEWASTYEKYGRQVLRGATHLRLTLPLDHPLAETERLTAWVLDLKLIKEDTSFTGYCGLALNRFDQPVHPGLYGPAGQALASLVMRHLGLGWEIYGLPEIIRYESGSNEFRVLIKRANWLNLICDHTLEALGGRSAVLELLKSHPELRPYELKHGLAIRAGDSPQIGDIGHRDFLPLYREVARIIKPVRLPKIGGAGASFMPSASNEWLNAFDNEYG